jgi:hypothetical protein
LSVPFLKKLARFAFLQLKEYCKQTLLIIPGTGDVIYCVLGSDFLENNIDN